MAIGDDFFSPPVDLTIPTVIMVAGRDWVTDDEKKAIRQVCSLAAAHDRLDELEEWVFCDSCTTMHRTTTTDRECAPHWRHVFAGDHVGDVDYSA